jgi:hypothetical protein
MNLADLDFGFAFWALNLAEIGSSHSHVFKFSFPFDYIHRKFVSAVLAFKFFSTHDVAD